jgi:hypothetical protein
MVEPEIGLRSMDWKQDLQALIEATMAFAKSVKSEPISNMPPAVRLVEKALAESKPVGPAIPPATLARSERDEILQRVSDFKAHQEKVARDREDYYLKMKAVMMAPPLDPKPGLPNARKSPPPK